VGLQIVCVVRIDNCYEDFVNLSIPSFDLTQECSEEPGSSLCFLASSKLTRHWVVDGSLSKLELLRLKIQLRFQHFYQSSNVSLIITKSSSFSVEGWPDDPNHGGFYLQYLLREAFIVSLLHSSRLKTSELGECSECIRGVPDDVKGDWGVLLSEEVNEQPRQQRPC
jgi:hypothetical protein